MQKVSLRPRHWRQARWLLGTEAVVLALIGIVALSGVFFGEPKGTGFSLGAVTFTPALSWTLIGVAGAAAVAVAQRRLALWFTAVTSVAALLLMFIGAVAGIHHEPGPLDFSAASTLLFTPIFCFNFAVGIWLVPDHIEGPGWLPRRSARGREVRAGSAGRQQ
ncbi:hypothetical protein NGTWS0302_32660 [Mycolicibacterium cyprinidarum]|uniref:Uncharacterized protein n=1 Tax=Mycolicibacterium cyprinidarum TaxID=2860311 RepID=A0ABQ4VD24_9MYCO|nr:hypothetical protein NGTWS0302_32660 [Mycolicibacterium sp. NGTWS0302]GJF20165.1 hypothetical protein NGTWS1702_29200 [Mycolicibacterium sp. NGTWSNA01]